MNAAQQEPTTADRIFARYGPLVDVNAVAQLLHLAPSTVLARRKAGTLGFGMVWQNGYVADFQAVADHIDRVRAAARVPDDPLPADNNGATP